MSLLDLFKRKRKIPKIVKKMREECLRRVVNGNGKLGEDIGWYYLTQKEFDDLMCHFLLASSITEKETRYKEGMLVFGLKIKIIDRR